jgi:predicted transcriptional regulator of viral defense system
MSQVEALSRLEALGQPLFETRDIAALLGQKDAAATLTASRLAKAGFLIKLARGKWALRQGVNRLAIPEHLTAPFPSYISLQSALFHHGMISQLPAVTYAVSLARTRRYTTPLGTVSIHHVDPDFFFGFELDDSGTAKIATPEKALLDIFYFSPTRTRLFVKLPEIEFPSTFSWRKAFAMTAKIKGRARRTFVERALLSLRNSPNKENLGANAGPLALH